jgi:signal transduction histidine kinase
VTATRTPRPCDCHDTLVVTTAHELRTPLTSLHLRRDLLAQAASPTAFTFELRRSA